MKIVYTLQVITNNEYADEYPTHARVVLDDKLIKRICILSDTARKLNVYKICDWDTTPDYLNNENEDEEMREWEGTIETNLVEVQCGIETNLVEVQCGIVHWSGYIKHTNIMIETSSIDIREIKENFNVTKLPDRELPLVDMDKLEYETSKGIVNQRLKGE
jgi:hypothetical protein